LKLRSMMIKTASPILGRSILACFACFASLVAVAAPARAADDEERAHSERGKAAYALGHFSEAADEYEAAFKLAPSPPLLYNAAQSHRLAGHKERALELYQSYLRVYGRSGKNREEAEQHIANLTRAIEEDHHAATAPPTTMATEGTADHPESRPITPPLQPASAVPQAVPPAPPPAAALVATPGAREGETTPLTSRPWFWLAIGGGVAIAVVAVVLLAGGKSSPPTPSAGTINGN
jgi:tetratricopeptide (TPR) repeat protein